MTRRSRYALRTILGSALIVATLAIACRTATQSDDDHATASAAESTVMSFPTPDEGLIYAHEYGDGHHAVVLAHGGRFNKESWETQARVLARQKFRVLAIDFRGYGQSRGGTQANDDHYLDILGAVQYLRRTGAKTISVIGGSFGGGAAAEAAVHAAPGEIDRLVLLAHSSIQQPEKMQGRKLFIIARNDPHGSGRPRLPDIRKQYDRAPEPKELVILDGAAHAQHIFKTEQGDRLMQEILRFLSKP